MKPKILVVVQNPAGFRCIFPVIEYLKDKVEFDVLVSRDVEKIIRNKINYLVVETVEEIEELIRQNRPNLILTGTTHKDSIEKKAINIGKEVGIKVVSILDSWRGYWQRFSDLEKNIKFRYIPDFIIVMDEFAKKEMVEEGFDEEKLLVLGNPYFDEILKYKNIRKEPSKQKRILFVSEPLREVFGNEIGYDEYKAFENLSEIYNSLEDFEWVIRPHPKENKEKFKLKEGMKFDDADNEFESIIKSDLVIGMASIMLFEAHILGKKVISYQPNLKGKNVLDRFGIISIYKKEELLSTIQEVLNKEKTETNYKIKDGATRRVAERLLSIINSKRIALECSNKQRDLDGLILLKIEFEKRGYEVMIFNQEGHDTFIKLKRFLPQIIVIPAITDEKTLKIIKYSRNFGAKIVELKVEELFPEKLIETATNKYEDVSLIDLEIVWGEKFKKALLKDSNVEKEKVFVCGNPKFDIYKKNNVLMIKKRFCEKYKLDEERKIITYATGFPPADYNKRIIEGVHKNLKKGIDLYKVSEKSKEMRKIVFSMITNLAKELPNINFIVKVHPLEMVDFYRDNYSNLPNLIIIEHEVMPDVINISDIFVHSNSTASIEAWFKNLPTICLYPTTENELLTDFNKGGDLIKNYEILKERVKYYLDENPILEEKLRFREEYIKENLHKVDGKVSERIAELIDKFFRKDIVVIRKLSFQEILCKVKLIIRKIFMIPDDRSLFFWIKHNRYFDRVATDEEIIKREVLLKNAT